MNTISIQPLKTTLAGTIPAGGLQEIYDAGLQAGRSAGGFFSQLTNTEEQSIAAQTGAVLQLLAHNTNATLAMRQDLAEIRRRLDLRA